MDYPKPLAFKPQSEPDRIFDQGEFPRRFEFNADVARVFDDMVVRSIPMYEDTLNAVISWVFRFYQEGSQIYDLGCSTGSTLFALGSSLQLPLQMIGIDNSQAMLDKAAAKLADLKKHRIEWRLQNLQDVSIQNASVVIMNYTLQFLPIRERQPLLEKIYAGLRPNGLLILSEKLRSSNALVQEAMTHIYENFKLQNGYSRNEIERKKEALDDVLIPFSVEEHYKRLQLTGFTQVETILRWHNFATLVAIKA